MIILEVDEQKALREGSAAMQAIRAAVWSATPAQIEAAVDGLTLDQAKKLISVLALTVKDHEKRIRALEQA